MGHYLDHEKHNVKNKKSLVESCCVTLQKWQPFIKNKNNNCNKTSLVVEHLCCSEPSFKRPCLSDRATKALSRLSLLDSSDLSFSSSKPPSVRRRLKSRSTRRRSYGTCSDIPIAGTDSSSELFSWGSDFSEASRGNNRRERGRERDSGGSGEKEKESLSCGVSQIENQGNESGYGSEPGYRGDAELGYGDEVDTEEDEHRLSLWGDKFQGTDAEMDIAGENTLQKTHHRCRRKKHDVRMVDPPIV